MTEIYWLMPSNNSSVRNVEVTTAEQAFFSVSFDNLKDARKAALVANEYADFVENFYRALINNTLEDLLSEIDSIVTRHAGKGTGAIKRDSAISQKLSDADKAAINQIYSANINAIVREIRNAIIDEINAFNGDDDSEDFLNYLRGLEEKDGDENGV